MTFFRSSLTLFVLAAFGLARAATDIITSDFCIMGGGSSGTYAAIRLQQLGKTVTLVEKAARLGGHVDTYVDPSTGKTFDFGVIVFDDISVVTNYFEYLDVPLAPFGFLGPAATTTFVDFSTGNVVPDTSIPQGNLTAALLGFLAQSNKYPYISNGFNLPSPIPEDFLITWGEFLAKYNLGDLAFASYTFLQGVGNILAQTSLYIFKYLTKQTAENILDSGFLSTANHDNQELYDKALRKLGGNAFISSNVTHVSRVSDCVNIFVSTPSGPKIIKSSKLLIAIQPKVESLGFLDMDHTELSLFGKFNNSYYWDGIIRNSGIPDTISLQNYNLAAPYGIPSMPGIYSIGATGLPNLHTVYYSSPSFVSDADVKAEIFNTMARLVKSLGYKTNATAELVAFNNHAPFELTVSKEEVKNGFYDKVNKLQGNRNTFWTGATWQAHDSSEIWNWTEYTLLPQLLA